MSFSCVFLCFACLSGSFVFFVVLCFLLDGFYCLLRFTLPGSPLPKSPEDLDPPAADVL